jgi:hypothetical protein
MAFIFSFFTRTNRRPRRSRPITRGADPLAPEAGKIQVVL